VGVVMNTEGFRESWNLSCISLRSSLPILANRWNISTLSAKTSLGTTSNDQLAQEVDKVALLFVEEVHWAVYFRFSLLDGESLLMRHLGQVRDTLQDP
jgi:hypothetical protein